MLLQSECMLDHYVVISCDNMTTVSVELMQSKQMNLDLEHFWGIL